MNSKGAAYSSILAIFPAFIVAAWILARTGTAAAFIEQISYAVGVVFPPGSRRFILDIVQGKQVRPVKEIVSASTVMIMAATGVMISWMNSFRRAYGINPNPWGFWRERWIALVLVFFGFAPMAFAMSLIAFGNQIEAWLVLHTAKSIGPFILFLWTLGRWSIAAVTSVFVIALIYHWGLPRVQPFHRVFPGAVLATMLWFPVTLGFGLYVTRYANYRAVYGPLGAGIALLVWLYIISIIILLGAEFNAVACPPTDTHAGDKDRRAESDRRKGDRRNPS